MAAHEERPDPRPSTVRPPDPRSPGEPPDILVTALVALLVVVAAVCLLAVTHSLWALLLAAGVMVATTLVVIFIISLQLDQCEQSQPSRTDAFSRHPHTP